MSATIPAVFRSRSASAPRHSVVQSERLCQYCCSELATAARKCPACGEWVVHASGGMAAALLRLLGWLWGGASALVALGTWYGGTAVRTWIVARAVEPVVALVIVDAIRYALVAIVLLQGLTVAVGLSVVANLAPRRPRWWA